MPGMKQLAAHTCSKDRTINRRCGPVRCRKGRGEHDDEYEFEAFHGRIMACDERG
jgi:hypothetical protein